MNGLNYKTISDFTERGLSRELVKLYQHLYRYEGDSIFMYDEKASCFIKDNQAIQRQGALALQVLHRMSDEISADIVKMSADLEKIRSIAKASVINEMEEDIKKLAKKNKQLSTKTFTSNIISMMKTLLFPVAMTGARIPRNLVNFNGSLFEMIAVHPYIRFVGKAADYPAVVTRVIPFSLNMDDIDLDNLEEDTFWSRSMERRLGGKDNARTFRMEYGMAIAGEARRIAVIEAPKGRGKTMFLDALQYALGGLARPNKEECSYAIKIGKSGFVNSSKNNLSDNAKQAQLVRLNGARLGMIEEISVTDIWDSGTLKEATGGSTFSGRELGKNPIQIPSIHLSIGTNEGAAFTSIDPAVLDRMRKYVFQEITDDERMTKMPDGSSDYAIWVAREHGQEIVNWLIRGWIDYSKNGWFESDDFKSWQSELLGMAEKQDTLMTFLNEYRLKVIANGPGVKDTSATGIPLGAFMKIVAAYARRFNLSGVSQVSLKNSFDRICSGGVVNKAGTLYITCLYVTDANGDPLYKLSNRGDESVDRELRVTTANLFMTELSRHVFDYANNESIPSWRQRVNAHVARNAQNQDALLGNTSIFLSQNGFPTTIVSRVPLGGGDDC